MANEEEKGKKKGKRKKPVEIKPDSKLESRIISSASSVKDKGKGSK
jgi:hypothetical protein